ncbi:ROK family transcriptional regulator [Pseudonocardia sp.]|uniref:ROK family transcriptional regulator n=1 Tax=Pseudonocardia sp. TaxID=60912 RepID=UPI0026066A31|nr:ROK family transcriptional regulator [Pseudonocardia sp.]
MHTGARAARPGSLTSLRAANHARVLAVLQASGARTQAELARATGLAQSTVSNIVRELAGSGAVSVNRVRRDGRTAQVVRLSRSVGLLAGIDVGHRHLTVGLADATYEILAHERIPLDADHRAGDCLAEAGRLLDTLVDRIGAARDEVIGIGMGLPAPIDSRTGEVGAPSILPGWVGVDAAALAGKSLGVAVEVDNDANLGALAEARWGAGRGARILAYLKLSDGVGAGLVVDGLLHRGPAGTAGEIGHTTIEEFGAVCRCGNRGCLETLVSTGAVLDLLVPRHGPHLTIADVVARARSGDAGCLRVLADTGRHIGIGVANLCNVFNPDRIVLGGELAGAGDLVVEPLHGALQRYGIPSAVRAVDIVIAALGDRSHLLGAVALGGQVAGQVIASFAGDLNPGEPDLQAMKD